MIRLATIYLLIVVLLSCPYQCLGKIVREGRAPCQKSAMCCRDQDQSPDDKTPPSPNERGDNCLCHGAVFDGSWMADDELTSPVVMHWVLEVTSPTIPRSLVAVSFESPQQFPPFSTGRDVCALTCTLQL